MAKSVPLSWVVIIWLGLFSSASSAQSLVPMKKKIVSFRDTFAVHVDAINPQRKPLNMTVRVYDKKFRLVKARVSPKRFRLGGRSKRRVKILVPFGSKKVKRVYICSEAFQGRRGQINLRTRVCGRFIAQRIASRAD